MPTAATCIPVHIVVLSRETSVLRKQSTYSVPEMKIATSPLTNSRLSFVRLLIQHATCNMQLLFRLSKKHGVFLVVYCLQHIHVCISNRIFTCTVRSTEYMQAVSSQIIDALHCIDSCR